MYPIQKGFSKTELTCLGIYWIKVISIVTPVFNGESSLSKTLKSFEVQECVAEYILSDGGSTDNSVAQFKNAGLDKKIIRCGPDLGMYDAIAKGFTLASGDILGWLNSGDIYHSWTLSTVERVFQLYPDVEWITGIPSILHADRNVLEVGQFAPVYIRGLVCRGWHDGARLDFIQQESTFWRRSLWERSGAAQLLAGKGRGSGYATDYMLWKRFAQFAQLHTVASLLASFAVTPGQISERHRRAYFAECGVRDIPARTNRWNMILFRLYSALMARRCIRV